MAPDGSCVLRYELVPALQQGPLGLESATDRLQYLEDLNVLHPEAGEGQNFRYVMLAASYLSTGAGLP